MREGASNQSPDLKNYTVPGPRPLLKNSWIRQWLTSSNKLFVGQENQTALPEAVTYTEGDSLVREFG